MEMMYCFECENQIKVWDKEGRQGKKQKEPLLTIQKKQQPKNQTGHKTETKLAAT